MNEKNQRESTTSEVNDEILHDHNHDGIDRRGFLKCMAWAGTGAFCVIKGGVLNSYSLSGLPFSEATNIRANSASSRSATATWGSTRRRILTSWAP